MWVFTEIADWFDKTRADNDAWIDSGLQPWVATTLYDDSPWYRNVGVWAAAGTLYSLNKFTTTVASGFVDVLRLGDGVQEGGWGYGKDALRLLMVIGPALRGARWAVSLIPAVDVSPAAGNCTWVAAARLLRLTGTRPLAQLGDVAAFSGLEAGETSGAWPKELVPALRFLGANASEGKPIANMTDLAKVVGENPQGATLFSVNWSMGGNRVGHTLIAVRDLFGGLKIIDRTGRVVKSLAGLNDLYPGIGSAALDAGTVIADNSLVVKSLGAIPTLTNILSQGAADYLNSSTGDTSGPGASSGKSAKVVTPVPGPGAPLSPEQRKIYDAMGPGSPILTYRQIMQRSHLFIDAVIVGLDELSEKGKVVLLKGPKGEDPTLHKARRL